MPIKNCKASNQYPQKLWSESQSSTSLAHVDLFHYYEPKFAELLDDQKLPKLCSDAGFLKKLGKGQFFVTREEGSEVMQTACREYTTSKSENIPTERVDSFENENRPSLRCKNLS